MDLTLLIAAIVNTVQFKVLTGLIFLNLIMAIAAALRTGSFDWLELANWFRGQVMPYMVGYVGLVVAINYIFPADIANNPTIAEAGLTEWLNAGAINFAWLTLVGTMGQRVIRNGRMLYGGK